MSQGPTNLDFAVGLGLLTIVMLGLGFFVLVLFIWGMIFKRAGYSFAMALLMFIPLVNLIWLMIFAFSRWPIQRELDEYRIRGFPVQGYPPEPMPLPVQTY